MADALKAAAVELVRAVQPFVHAPLPHEAPDDAYWLAAGGVRLTFGQVRRVVAAAYRVRDLLGGTDVEGQ